MKNIFLDSNVILDAILKREGFETSAKVMQIGDYLSVKVCTSVLSIANIAYILRKFCVPADLKDILGKLFKRMTVLPMGDMVVYNALRAGHPDFEDALQIACADLGCCDLIITRDKRHFQNLPIPVYTPEEFYKAVTES